MNNSKTALLVDSGCDVGKEFATEYDIRILGLKVVYGMEVFSDGVDIDPMTVYERFQRHQLLMLWKSEIY